ncbi:hypothetical protein N9E35_01635 [Candidatus Marinimicrobia bacterium]|nr:hypothetical protein [Candidatus Neomarinimicrobiota bacterium]
MHPTPLMTEQLEQINNQINEMMQKGDFGTPASPELISQAWKKLTSELVARLNEGKPIYNNISGLWFQGERGKVAYNGYAKEEITIPKDTKILAFRQDKTNDTQPDLSLVFVTYESN